MHKDIGRYADYTVNAVAAVNLAAGTSMQSSGAPAALTSPIIDRLSLAGGQSLSGPRIYRSVVLAVGVEAQMPAGFTANVRVKLQDADATSAFSDYTSGTQASPGFTFGSTSTTGVLTLESGGGTTGGALGNPQTLAPNVCLPIDLGAARRYLQAVVTPSHQSSSSGYIAVGAAFVFGGAEELGSTS
jgi:hypothetical protein